MAMMEYFDYSEVRLAQAEANLCRDLRILTPDYAPSHHGPGCGCPVRIDEETGLFDARQGHYFFDGAPCYTYDTDYPFFVCPDCRRLVPWCFGCAHEDEYLAECCDECAVKLLELVADESRWGVEWE
jgi:hypothetical protein